jgi:hypothetical protein
MSKIKEPTSCKSFLASSSHSRKAKRRQEREERGLNLTIYEEPKKMALLLEVNTS